MYSVISHPPVENGIPMPDISADRQLCENESVKLNIPASVSLLLWECSIDWLKD